MSILHFLWRVFPSLLFGFPGQRPGGLMMTLLLTMVSVLLGFGVAVLIGNIRSSSNQLLRTAAAVYINVFRGLPLLLLMLLIYQFIGGRRFGLDISPVMSGLIALTLYTSAYQAEIVRAGLTAVPQQVIDSARLLGANSFQVFLLARLRYALRVMQPAFVGQVITLFKDSSVLVVLGVADLMTVARATLGSDVRNSVYWVPMYLTVGLLYAVVALTFSRLSSWWERGARLAYSLDAIDHQSLPIRTTHGKSR